MKILIFLFKIVNNYQLYSGNFFAKKYLDDLDFFFKTDGKKN